MPGTLFNTHVTLESLIVQNNLKYGLNYSAAPVSCCLVSYLYLVGHLSKVEAVKLQCHIRGFTASRYRDFNADHGKCNLTVPYNQIRFTAIYMYMCTFYSEHIILTYFMNLVISVWLRHIRKVYSSVKWP